MLFWLIVLVGLVLALMTEKGQGIWK